jgi:hypothetical protein
MQSIAFGDNKAGYFVPADHAALHLEPEGRSKLFY